MCSQRMDNYQGDLTDILRATGSIVGGGDGDCNVPPVAAADTSSAAAREWRFPTDPIGYSTDPAEDFGDPFGHLRDPLLNDIDAPVSGFFSNSNSMIKAGIEETAGNSTGGFAGGVMKRPAANMFSRMLQISPNAKLPMAMCDSPAAVTAASPRVLKGVHPPMLVSNHDHGLISPTSSKSNCLVESQGLQISSPRNTGIKRRKSQAKKVVCIPAPAPANSRPSGEVVPSDLWAWRKYGQKPIKGSPYPRGYYRCSSSKGCSARKQVERSRTDPNMLVITYTSEHNHPWPTQRNALAGSTRAASSKNAAAATAVAGSKDTPSQKPTNPKEEHRETTTENATPPPSSAVDAINVKEENADDHNHLEKNTDDPDQFERGFPSSYKPALPESNHSEDNFFADLGEIEADSLDMLFTQGFSGDDGVEDKTLDPFTFYDWAGSNSATSSSGQAAAAASCISGATTSYGDPTKRGS